MTPFERLKYYSGIDPNTDLAREEALLVTKKYVGLMKRFGLINSRVLEGQKIEAEDPSIRDITSVHVMSDSTICISFTLDFKTESCDKVFQIRISPEVYNNLISPGQFPSDWRTAFYINAKKYVDKMVDDQMLILGKWIDRSDTLKKLIEKSGE